MGGSRKRSYHGSHRDSRNGRNFGLGETVSRLDPNRKSSTSDAANHTDGASNQDEWKTVDSRARKRQKREPKKPDNNYPVIAYSSTNRLQSQVKLSDFQALILYILADGPGPQWIAVRHKQSFRKAVVLMVPGLESSMFLTSAGNEDASLDGLTCDPEKQSIPISADQIPPSKKATSPDDYYPVELQTEHLHNTVKPLAGIFSHMWPIRSPGDDKFHRVHSPVYSMLTVPVSKSKEEKQMRGPTPARESKSFKPERTSITHLLATFEELEGNEYILHPALFPTEQEKLESLQTRKGLKQPLEDGWFDTAVGNLDEGAVTDKDVEKGSMTAGRNVIAMDCEMCQTEGETFELTRISLIAWDGSVILDELVKPDKPITNYLTA